MNPRAHVGPPKGGFPSLTQSVRRRETPAVPANRARMKIAQVKVDLLNVPLERPFQAAGREVRNYWYVVAHVLTSDDVAGFGYVIMLQDELVPSLAAATRELQANDWWGFTSSR